MDRGSYVPILMYHQVAADSEIQKPGGRYVLAASDFEEQMELLTHLNYSAVTLSDFIAYTRGETSLPMRPVIITFDDGHESNYKVAYPILKRFALTAAFFVVVSHLDSPGRLTVKQMEEMNAEGMSIQSHTLTHPYLIKLDKEQMEKELSESKRLLEEQLGSPVHFLSIPHGLYDKAVKKAACEAGYLAMLTSDMGLNNRQSDSYSLKRICVDSGIHISGFALLLEGKGILPRRLRQLTLDLLKRFLGVERYARMKSTFLRRGSFEYLGSEPL
jgi:peptidoglycan/xylan/chitin deacetylase (PgdA/CDA1 family)